MNTDTMKFSHKEVSLLFNADLLTILAEYPQEKIIILSDENVFAYHKNIIGKYAHIIVFAGEKIKTQTTVDGIIQDLLKLSADKKSILVGMGGGVVTDMAGYVASVYKRGMPLLQVPTSILGMVDAAVGGKNGVDVGAYKNMVGTIYQPDKIIFDYSLLKSLPKEEWINGFAEIIKHACIKDAEMFSLLEAHDINYYQENISATAALIEANVTIKKEVVVNDETEEGDRKLLNFGHTLGHAIENAAALKHGHAISIGMMAACNISEELNGFKKEETERLGKLFKQYHLPVSIHLADYKIWDILLMDKKRNKDEMSFVVLNSIGKATIKNIPLTELEKLIKESL